MILMHPDFETPITFYDGVVHKLVVNNQKQFFKYVSELYNQSNGEEGQFILSEHNDEIDIQKAFEVVTDLFSLNANDRSTVNALMKKLSLIALDENNRNDTLIVMNDLEKYLNDLLNTQDVQLEVDEPNVPGLLKAFNLRFQTSNEIVEMICDYISIKAIYSVKKIFAFVNLETFLSKEQIIDICNHAFNENVFILLIEQHNQMKIDGEVTKTIDEDFCEY